MSTTERYDALVIGAGPSGTVAAAWLARQGHKVAVVERAKFPRFVIGESLLPLSMGHWEEAGLLPALMAQDYAVKRGARFHKQGKAFDLSFDENFTQGWTWTWQVPRDHFDNVLAEALMAKGVPVHFQQAAVAVDLDHPDGVRLETSGPGGDKAFTAPFIIDSSGYGGTLVKLLGLPDERAGNGRMALFTQVEESAGHRAKYQDPMLICFDVIARDLWSWVIPFSNGRTSIGFVGHRSHFEAAMAGGSNAAAMRAMLERQKAFGDRFDGVGFTFEPHAIEEYAHYNRGLSGERYVLTGNCAGFLDPVFSSGVAFATESGLLAAKLLDRQLRGGTVDWKKEYDDHIVRGAEVFRSYVEDWYSGDLQDVFFAEDLEPSHKQRIVSVLAGYVWDGANTYVTKHHRAVKALAQTIRIRDGHAAATTRSSK